MYFFKVIYNQQKNFSSYVQSFINSYKEFKITPFERKVLLKGVVKGDREDINRLHVATKASMDTRKMIFFTNLPSTHSSISLYQRIYRQFNNKIE